MKKIFLYFLLMGFLFSACEDSLEVAPPNNLTDEMIQETWLPETKTRLN